MYKYLWLLPTLAILIMMPACKSPQTSASAKMLKFNFEKGKTYDYEMSMSMDQQVEGQPLKMNGIYQYSMNVVGEEGADKTITSTIDRFAMVMDAGIVKLNIDTDKPLPGLSQAMEEKNPERILNGIFGAIKGQIFSMKISPEGKVLEVKGFENMAAGIFDSLGLDSNSRANALAQFNEQFNAEKMKGQFERTWYIFPNKEVNVGENWQKETDLDAGGIKGKIKSAYKVTDIEGEMVTLSENSVIETTGDEKGSSGTINGTLIVDSRSGLVVSGDQDLKISLNSGSGTTVMNMKVKVKGVAR